MISALFTQSSSVEKEGKKSSGLGFRVRVGAQTCNTCNGFEYRRERESDIPHKKNGKLFCCRGRIACLIFVIAVSAATTRI